MGRKRTPAETRIQQINELPNIKFVRWGGPYTGVHAKAVCLCLNCNYEWTATPTRLIHRGNGCPQCAGLRRWSADERVSQINAIENVKFVRWNGLYTGTHSGVTVRCEIDGFEWSTKASQLINKGTGCPQCRGVRKWTKEDRIEQINSMPNIKFIRWSGEFIGNKSKVACRCDTCEMEWTTSVMSLIDHSSGCPHCAGYGYSASRPGTLYALLSECGRYVKVGISNNYETRHATLKRTTPFRWSCVELIHGDGGEMASLERYFHGKYEAAKFKDSFDGYTEWLMNTPELMREIRSIGARNA